MMTKFHYHFFLPDSPWPLICSVSAFNFLFSALLFMKFGDSMALLFSLFFLPSACFLWWVAYSNEMNLFGSFSYNLEMGLKLAMLLFISSEVFFFFSFFWSYFHYFLSPSMETGLSWPPLYLEMFDCSNVPMINTLILLSSGVTMTMAHHFMMTSEMKACSFNMFLTFVLGVTFSYLQWMEYNSSFFGVSDSTFGASFFLLTGFHGIHVLIGTIFITISGLRMPVLACGVRCCSSMEMAAWYWHFVDVVWIFLYYFIYYMNN